MSKSPVAKRRKKSGNEMDCTEQVAQLQQAIQFLESQLNLYKTKSAEQEITILELRAELSAIGQSDLGIGDLSIDVTTGNGGSEVKFTLPNGSIVDRHIPNDGPLTMRLGLGLGLTHTTAAGGGDAPEWLEDFRAPSGDLPIIAADFQAGNYWMGGSEVSVTDIFTGPNFHPEVIGASGIQPTFDNANGQANPQVPLLSATAITLCAAQSGLTFYGRFSPVASGVLPALFSVIDNVDWANRTTQVFCSRNVTFAQMSDDLGIDTAVSGWTDNAPHGVAANLLRPAGGGNYNSVVAVDGAADPSVDVQTFTIVPALIALGAYDNVTTLSGTAPELSENSFIERFSVWAGQPDADIAAISDL